MNRYEAIANLLDQLAEEFRELANEHVLPGPLPQLMQVHTMTMPSLMNCPHNPDGWCLACVKERLQENDGDEMQINMLKSQRDVAVATEQNIRAINNDLQSQLKIANAIRLNVEEIPDNMSRMITMAISEIELHAMPPEEISKWVADRLTEYIFNHKPI